MEYITTRRLLCFLLIFIMLTSACFLPCAKAETNYVDLIVDILDSFDQINDSASGTPQQLANGAYRCAELLTVIAYELDNFGSYSSLIESIYNSLNDNEKTTKSAPQQAVNGFYRCTEMLTLIAIELDDTGTGFFKDYALLVLDDLEKNNEHCNGAPQQIANGTYRMFDALTIIAYELGVNSETISFLSDSLEENDKKSSGVDHQIVNGLYRCAELLYLIVSEVNDGSLQSFIDGALDDLEKNDQRCQSAPQQEVNGAYRCVELLAYWGLAIDR